MVQNKQTFKNKMKADYKSNPLNISCAEWGNKTHRYKTKKIRDFKVLGKYAMVLMNH